MKGTCIFAILALALTGCASNPVDPASAVAVPQDFVMVRPSTEAADSASVTFTRDSGGPPGSRWTIYIDGQATVKIGKNEKFETRVAAGEHIFGIEPDAKIKVLPIINVANVAVPNGRYFYRAMYTGAGYQLQPTVQVGDAR